MSNILCKNTLSDKQFLLKFNCPEHHEVLDIEPINSQQDGFNRFSFVESKFF